VTLTIAPVRKEVVVNAPAQRAFDVFTKQLASWWPYDTHKLGDGQAETVVMEAKEGGRLYQRDTDGSECEWGHVRVWEPPARVVFTWEISADFRPDPNITAEVEVRFVAESPSRTRVELEHRNLEAFGERAPELRQAFDSDGGWGGLLAKFAEAASA
jgi:uncharacterized protein YndB with AHSA1/START domain